LAYVSSSRPDRPEQAAVVMPDNTVQVWSLDGRGPVATFAAGAALTADSALFSADGSRLAVKNQSGYTSVWSVDDPGRSPRTIPTGIVLADRPFTAEETALLRTRDAPVSRPCP
jgi:hypothetical protein